MNLKGNKLTIEVDITQIGDLSKSGKSHSVASTEGNITVEGTDLKMGLNVYKPIAK